MAKLPLGHGSDLSAIAIAAALKADLAKFTRMSTASMLLILA